MSREKKTIGHVFVSPDCYKRIVDAYRKYELVTLECAMEPPVVIKDDRYEKMQIEYYEKE